MSLIRPPSIWSSCGSNPFECHKAGITTRMLSGRYLTDKLQRQWTHKKAGTCLLLECFPGSEGSLEHLPLRCEALSHTRSNLMSLCFRVAAECDELYRIITCVSVSVIRDRLLYIGRTWCYSIHREQMTQLGLLDFS
jgi:hypothetical protein